MTLGELRGLSQQQSRISGSIRRLTKVHPMGPGDERELLFRRQMDYLAPAIQRFETVDVVLRTLPAERNFQSHKICDVTDKRSAIGYFGAPDR